MAAELACTYRSNELKNRERTENVRKSSEDYGGAKDESKSGSCKLENVRKLKMRPLLEGPRLWFWKNVHTWAKDTGSYRTLTFSIPGPTIFCFLELFV